VSRSSFYRFDRTARPVLATSSCGMRSNASRGSGLATDGHASPPRLRRQGWTVNSKRSYRLIREDNLLCVRKRKFVVTTDSNHGCMIYPSLLEDFSANGKVSLNWLSHPRGQVQSVA
jgi:putative transposase